MQNNIHDGFGEYAVTHQVNINIALVACSLKFSVAYLYVGTVTLVYPCLPSPPILIFRVPHQIFIINHVNALLV